MEFASPGQEIGAAYAYHECAYAALFCCSLFHMILRSHRLCIVSTYEMPDVEAEAVVERAAEELGVRYARIEWGWTRETPDWCGIAQADQVEATLRDAGPNAQYLMIEITEFDSPENVE